MKNKRINVGFHSWSPILNGEVYSPDPNGIWMKDLFKFLYGFNISSYWFGKTHDVSVNFLQTNQDVSNMDLMFFYWRWQLPALDKYAERNQAVDDQWNLIKDCIKYNVPMVVCNGDYKITDDEVKELYDLGAILTAPAHFPPLYHTTLHYPMFFDKLNVGYGKRGDWITYIGNNYERLEFMKKYLAFGSDWPEVLIYGNWLDSAANSGRELPNEIISALPDVRFKGKCPQAKVIKTLSEATATIHVGKDSYMKTGLIALRWLEAIAAGTVAFVPKEYRLPTTFPGVVRHKHDIRTMFKFLDRPGFAEGILKKQTRIVEEWTDPIKWISAIRLYSRK